MVFHLAAIISVTGDPTGSYCPAVSHCKASNELGYVSRPIHETVRDTLAWFEQRTSAALASRAG